MNKTEDILQAGSSSNLVECGVIPHQVPLRERPILMVLASVHFIHIMDFMMMLPLGPQFMKLFDITPQQFGLLISAYAFSAGVCSFLASFFIDRFDRKHVLILLCTGMGMATLICALATDYAMLLLGRMVTGGFSGMLSAIIFAIVADIIPEHRRGVATGTVMSAFSIVAVVGMPIGMLLVNLVDWRAPFYLLSAVSSLMIIISLRVLPSLRDHLIHHQERHPFQQLRAIFWVRNHLYAFALIAMLMFAGFCVSPFISTYMVINVGMAEIDLPYLYFFGGLATFFAARILGRLADLHGMRKTFGVTAALSVFPILLLTHLSTVPTVFAVAITTLFMMLVSGRFVPAMALVTASVIPRLRGSFLSFNISVQQLSAGLASLLTGSIMGISANGALTHYDSVGIIASIATILSILLAVKVDRYQE
ncbi:MFS transporter [Nitrosomonas sp. Nm34]|uniref:MFS transporter n=1 Tax=Nitrosomonas sp. Nm34 TaxID=1881055 RepID=UPI0008E83930|nr:MFS transporter [Nitrosomonas sp. Nm34]SFI97673.1 Predicted arabinose efflux permease, MFS family [Nitrosomonas sp. Nm34]